MAKLKICAVWDNAVGAYGSFHDAITEGIAIRNFSDAAGRSDSALSKYPDDFSLHVLGEVDTETGLIVCPKVPKNLGTARSLAVNVSSSPELSLTERGIA